MPNLFTPFTIKDMTLKNRIVMPPMCMYSALDDGIATPWHLVHYASRAVGGTGLIIVEATGILPEGRISSGDLGIWDDDQTAGLGMIAAAIQKNGAKAGIQLNHAGRKCEAQVPRILAPSALQFDETYKTPVEMTLEDIAHTVQAFKTAASRILKAGFDVVEIHAAHGYLLNQFLSPLTNNRADAYGGSMGNRARIVREVIAAVREVWPMNKPLFLRITAEDYMEGGNVAEDLAEIINHIKDAGIDLVDVSTGGVVPVAPKAFPGYQIRHAEIIKSQTGLPVLAGGLITEAELANEVIELGKAELVYVGRGQLRNPYWALKASTDLNIDIDWPKQYERAKEKKRG
jgi:NADPH2 dehydrogenase